MSLPQHCARNCLRLLAALAVAFVVLLVFVFGTTMPKATADRSADPRPHEWIIATGVTGTVTMIDTSTDIAYGPVLSGQLGSSGGSLFDVAVTPDGKTALFSNFGDSTVYFVDVSRPLSPSVMVSVTTPMFAEDIVISDDGRFALVTDGGFSPLVAVIDLVSQTLAYSVTLPGGYAQAVDIARDGTVVVVSFGSYARSVQTLYPDTSGHLTVTGSYSYGLTPQGQISFTGSLAGGAGVRDALRAIEGMAQPTTSMVPQALTANGTYYPQFVNVAIAPDNQTVILCDVGSYTGVMTDPVYSVGVYRITAPGVLSFTGVITGLQRATQSIAFSKDGTKAYLSGNGGYSSDPAYDPAYDHLTVLNITAPGLVSLDRMGVVDYPRMTSSQLFGVDTIAVANGKAYLGYPTISGARTDLRVVNLSDYSVKRVDLHGISTGVAVIPVHTVYLPLAVAQNTDN